MAFSSSGFCEKAGTMYADMTVIGSRQGCATCEWGVVDRGVHELMYA
jgi:hypothetical protein